MAYIYNKKIRFLENRESSRMEVLFLYLKGISKFCRIISVVGGEAMSYYDDDEIYDELINIFQEANQYFLNENIHLLIYEVSERSLCGALMKNLYDVLRNTEFNSYYVDIEYNRNKGGKLKTVLKTINGPKERIINITSDLIIHSRGENIQNDNLITLEMKKSNRSEKEKDKDRDRLSCLTKSSYDDVWSYDGTTLPEHVCRYILGIYYEIDFESRTIHIEYYRKGHVDRECVLNF